MKKFTLCLLSAVLTVVGSLSSFAAEKPVPTFSEVNTDGTVEQYLYNVEFDGFLVGANDWGTRASVDATKGLKVKITAVEGGTYIIGAMSPDAADGVWIDGSRDGNNKFTITINEDKTFAIGCTKFADTYLSWGGKEDDTRLNFTATKGTWAAVSEADYNTYVQALKEYNKAIRIAESGILRVKADTEFTGEIADLDGKTLVLVDAETSDKLLYNVADAQDMAAGALSELEGTEYFFTKFAKADVTVEGVEGDIYTMQMINSNGTNFSKWGTQGYVNFQPDPKTIVFALGLEKDGNKIWGQDAENHALWTVTKEENGYVIKNVGRGTYFNPTLASPACTDKAYFKFYAETEWYKEEPQPVAHANDLRLPLTGGSAAGSELAIEVLESNEEGQPLSAKYTITNGTWGDNASHLSIFKYKPLSADMIKGYKSIVVEFEEALPVSEGDATYTFIPCGFVCPEGWIDIDGMDKFEMVFTDKQKNEGIADFSIFFNANGNVKNATFTIKGLWLVKEEVADAIEDAKTSTTVEDVKKVIINGKIYIKKGGKTYDTTGNQRADAKPSVF